MTEQEQQEARDKALQFGFLAAALLLAAAGSAALFYFLFRLAKNLRIGEDFDSLQEQARDALQVDFDRIVAEVAELSLTNLELWFKQMREIIEGYLIAQATVARARALLPSELLELDRGVIAEQVGFLGNFLSDLKQREITINYVTARARLYSGAGRALWYRQAEDREARGWVIDYIAVDDSGTCAPCIQAESGGPYLFGDGPFPGEVCLGRGRCRCRRQPRFDVTAWEGLSAERLDFAA